MKNKIKAYTILELLIVMILFTILVGTMYVFFSYLDKGMYAFKKYSEKLYHLESFNLAFKEDFYLAADIEVNKNTLRLKRYNQDFINYRFENNYLIRENQNFQKDTLIINNYSFEEDKINGNVYVKIKYDLKLKDKTISIFLFRKKDVEELVNLNSFYEN